MYISTPEVTGLCGCTTTRRRLKLFGVLRGDFAWLLELEVCVEMGLNRAVAYSLNVLFRSCIILIIK